MPLSTEHPLQRRAAGMLDKLADLRPAGPPQPHQLLLGWLIFAGTLAALLGIAWQENYFEVLLAKDRSRLSWLILLLFGMLSLHCGLRAWGLSVLLNQTQRIRALAEAHPGQILRREGDTLYLGAEALPECATTACLRELPHSRQATGQTTGQAPEQRDGVMELYAARLKRPHARGWFMADVMLKLGLLGTIVGFVLMLGSITEVKDLDVSSMQQVLREMSSGMATALYTTMAGLIGAILSSWQYHHLDHGADEILELTRYLAETRGGGAP